MEDKIFAVLVDANQTNPAHIKTVIDELTKEGVATIRRVYGDWAQLEGMRTAALDNAFVMFQQTSYATGKAPTTDSAMIIDAMDILYANQVDGFCLVSSQSDFTRLAQRLREAGKIVIGMGCQTTPKPFAVSCNRFVYLDVLTPGRKKVEAKPQPKKESKGKVETATKQTKGDKKVAIIPTESKKEEPGKSAAKGKENAKQPKADQKSAEKQVEKKKDAKSQPKVDEKANTKSNKKSQPTEPVAETSAVELVETPVEEVVELSVVEESVVEVESNITPVEQIHAFLTEELDASSDDDGWMLLSALGHRLQRRFNDYDPRLYGFKKTRELLESLGTFEFKSVPDVNNKSANGTLVYVRNRE